MTQAQILAEPAATRRSSQTVRLHCVIAYILTQLAADSQGKKERPSQQQLHNIHIRSCILSEVRRRQNGSFSNLHTGNIHLFKQTSCFQSRMNPNHRRHAEIAKTKVNRHYFAVLLYRAYYLYCRALRQASMYMNDCQLYVNTSSMISLPSSTVLCVLISILFFRSLGMYSTRGICGWRFGFLARVVTTMHPQHQYHFELSSLIGRRSSANDVASKPLAAPASHSPADHKNGNHKAHDILQHKQHNA